MIGQTLSHYRVLERLGGGGMGVVYRAEDLKLRRPVAIKVLPADLTRDDEAKRRFVLEAQAASALDHPNICTIYEIDETPDGQLFLAMAYYEGETLKAKIDRGPLKLDEALDYAIQMAQGLVKAHAAGIVHRDIKPANTLITTDGLVKIVDFGLARLLGQIGVTRTGTTLGTPAYMSPEQMLGAAVDARSDLWSLGVVLYEMLTGQLPFRGDHPQAIAHAIANAAPAPVTSVRSGIPLELERVVTRALAKRPEDRYQTAADLLSELRRVKRESDSQAAVTMTRGPRPLGKARVSRRALVWALAAAVALGALAYPALRWRTATPAVLALTNPVQVAGTVAIETRPAWSPDNRLIAYESDQSGQWDIWVAQAGGGQPINRTADLQGNSQLPRWSPDGRQIAFYSDREGGGAFVMSALAGSPRKVAPAPGGRPISAAWSPDGSELAYPIQTASDNWELEILNLQTGATRRLPVPDAAFLMDLAWSFDGRFAAFVQGGIYTSQVTRLWILDVGAGRARPLTDDRAEEWSPSWSPDSRVVYFTSNRGGTRDLLQQRLDPEGAPLGAAERVTTGIDMLQAAVSPDGAHVAYAKGRKVANVWRVPILPDRAATWADAEQITFDQAHIEFFDISLDGRRLAVQSDRGGNPDIWILPAAGGEMQQLTSDPTPDWAPAWAPDGEAIAFYAYRTGRREVWVQPLAGGAARQVTRTGASAPRWSHDGVRLFAYVGGIATISLHNFSSLSGAGSGDEQRQVVEPGHVASIRFSLSPDGLWILFTSNRSGENRVWRAPASGGEIQPVTDAPGALPEWAADGQSFFFVRGGNIWRRWLADRREHPMTELSGRRGFLENDPVTDGRHLYFSWREDMADIWTMDVAGGGTR